MSLLRVTALRKLLGGRWVLDGVDLSWGRPGTLVVAGENGAGKSTLLRVLAGILHLDEGAVTLGGHDLEKDRARALAEVGYAPEAADLPAHLGVGELVSLVASLKRCALPPPALVERLGVAPLVDKRLGALSLGQRRRAGLLAALTGDPPLLLLDEPTNGLDKEGIEVLASLLREREAEGRAAVVATHDLAFSERIGATRVELRAGRF